MSDSPKALILLSGGLDSSACVSFYLSRNYEVTGLYVDYNQAAAQKERISATMVSKHYNIKLLTLTCNGFREWGTGLIIGRNSFLLSTALLTANFGTGLIGIGLHSGTSYNDSSSYFLTQMQNLFNLYTDGRISIGAPFINWNKSDIWRFCLDASVPINLTYSCENGFNEPCGSCQSCKDREALYASQK